MEPYLFLIMIGLHIFALWPVTLFYCTTKKKRKPRQVGKSCESLLIDNRGSRSTIKSTLAGKKLTTPSKMLRPKPAEKKDNSNPKKKTENSEDKKDDLKKTGTTADTEKTKEKSSPRNAKTPADSKPSPKKEQSPKKAETKPNESKKEKATDKTQEPTENETQLSEPGGRPGRSEKTQSQTEQENMGNDTD